MGTGTGLLMVCGWSVGSGSCGWLLREGPLSACVCACVSGCMAPLTCTVTDSWVGEVRRGMRRCGQYYDVELPIPDDDDEARPDGGRGVRQSN